jgi:hypothetical protein
MDKHIATIDLAVVRDRLSPARLRLYEEAAGHDLAGAMDLYLWNLDLSAAFYGVLQGVEIFLRNALSEQMERLHLGRGYEATWFDDPFRLLDDRRRTDIDLARFRLHRDGHPATQDRLITEVPFGFWRFLLSTRHEHSLWIPALRNAFPHLPDGGRRRYVADRVARLHVLRNRIAHHEPVYRRRLVLDMEDAIDVVAAICPTAATWLEINSWAPGLLIGHVPMQSRSGD